MNERALALATGNLSAGSLGSYIHWVNQVPLLPESEERALSEKLQKNNDLESARRLIMSHLRFVVKIARGYAGYGLQLADLIQEGNIGLMKAVKRFDPAMGVRLVSFAVHWIRAEMHEFIIRNWRIVKIATTKAQRKLFFNIRKAAKKRNWFSESEVTLLAEELNVSHKDVRQMEMRMNHHDQSLEYSNDSDSDDNAGRQAPIHYLEDKTSNPESMVMAESQAVTETNQVHNALALLDERSQTIIKERWLSKQKSTLNTLAKQFNVSLERIRQLEKSALQKMRGVIAG